MVKTAQDVERLKQELTAKIEKAYAAKVAKSQAEVEAARQELERLEQLKTVRLTVARDLGEPAVDKIYQRVAEWVKDVVVDIAVDSRVLGGAKVEFVGKYYDGTVRNKLYEII